MKSTDCRNQVRKGPLSARSCPPAPEIRGWRLKAYEDKFDAVVCAAVAIAGLNGKAKLIGDEDTAIWVPTAGA